MHIKNEDSKLLEQLRSTLSKMELSLGAIRDPIIWVNDQGNIQWSNAKFPLMIGQSHISILGRSIAEFVPLKKNGVSVPWETILENAKLNDPDYHFNIYQFDIGNKTYYFKISASLFSVVDAEPSYVILLHDVTEAEHAKKHIEFLADIPDNNPAPVFSIRKNGEILFINKAATQLIKCWEKETDDLLPKSFTPLIEKSIEEKKEHLIEETCANNTYLFSITPSTNLEYVNIYGTNITKRKEAEKELLYLSHHDMLTGLYNRPAFEKALKKELANAYKNKTTFAILLLDLDNFKTVNDTFGHHIGDQLLMIVGKQLLESVRKEDFVARLGGDEFVIIFSNLTNTEDVTNFAKKLIQRFNKPFKLEDYYFHATVSIGIAVAPTAGKDETTLIKNADIALYTVKELGRNNFQFFSESIHSSFERRARLESALPQAITDNQFYLVYQPQYLLPHKKIAGIEVLLRWQHPTLGLIMPDDFIPLAEKTGLIVPIGEWVLVNAFKQYMTWQKNGTIPKDLKLAINLSPKQLDKPEFMGFFLKTLKETGMSPHNLELELTETAVMTSDVDMDPIFEKLQSIGAKISIDDFGVGYSSLTRLKNLPVSSLKIDKSFINDLDKGSDNATIVKSIIALGNSLGLRVIPEGVETEKQLNLLTEYNCSMVQGFYFGKQPLNANEMTNLLAEKFRKK